MKKNKRGGVREGAGRKATGLLRDKAFTIRGTEEEISRINFILNLTNLNKTDALLKLLKLNKEEFDMKYEMIHTYGHDGETYTTGSLMEIFEKLNDYNATNIDSVRIYELDESLEEQDYSFCNIDVDKLTEKELKDLNLENIFYSKNLKDIDNILLIAALKSQILKELLNEELSFQFELNSVKYTLKEIVDYRNSNYDNENYKENEEEQTLRMVVKRGNYTLLDLETETFQLDYYEDLKYIVEKLEKYFN